MRLSAGGALKSEFIKKYGALVLSYVPILVSCERILMTIGFERVSLPFCVPLGDLNIT